MTVTYKSKLLLIFNAVAACFIIINVFNLVSIFNMVSKPADGLSNSYLSIQADSKAKYEKMMGVLTDSDSFLVERDVSFQMVGVYYNKKMNINLIKGRLFNDRELHDGALVALIDESLENDCIKKSGKILYRFQNDYFEVIGKFKRSENTVNKDAYIYIPLTAALKNKYINEKGVYNIDSYCDDIRREKVVFDNSKLRMIDKIEMTVDEQKASVIALAVILAMILVNMVGVLKQWMLSRQAMIRAMYISGASFFQIKTKLAKEYTLLLIYSYIVAIIIAYLMTFIQWSVYETFEISVISIMISCIFYILFALPGVVYIFIKRQKIKE